MTLEELQEELEAFLPGATVSTDNDGQVIIHTGLMFDDDDAELDLIKFVCDEDLDEDFMLDGDIDQLEDEEFEDD
jgi:hypothetical protein